MEKKYIVDCCENEIVGIVVAKTRCNKCREKKIKKYEVIIKEWKK